MRTLTKIVGLATVVALSSLAQSAGATTYNTLYIHGRTTSPATPSGSSYWNVNGRSIATGSNIQYVNYNGNQHISQSNPSVVSALNTYCTGSTACIIDCHSAGCSQIGYAVANKTGTPWNIYAVVTAGSADGGSELAGNTAYFFTGESMDQDLAISTMRGMYNHDLLGNDITNYVYDELGGDWATLTTCFFEGGCTGGGGQNDSAVSFQSAGRFRNSGTEGSDGATGTTGGNWWNYSIAWTVDTSDTWGHCIVGSYPCEQGANNGVVSLMTGQMTYLSW
jgi:hypothetical protein